MDVQVNLDQSVQSEPRVRLQLAENLLRDAHALIHRLEVRHVDCSYLVWVFMYSLTALSCAVNLFQLTVWHFCVFPFCRLRMDLVLAHQFLTFFG